MSLVSTWRARRALLARGALAPIAPAPTDDLARLVDDLGSPLGATRRVDDDVVHERRDGRLQLVGLHVGSDAELGDLRERIVRVVHEMHLGHVDAARRRVVAVLWAPHVGDPRAWLARFDDAPRREPVARHWRAARRQVALVVVGARGDVVLRGGDHALDRALAAWRARQPAVGRPRMR